MTFVGDAGKGKTFAILTSGGDAPGMNAAIRTAGMFLRAHQARLVGVRQGYKGLLKGDFVDLGPEQIAHIIRDGGTMLGSARCLEFHEREGRDVARKQLADAGIDGLIVIGGNGSLTGAKYLTEPDETDDPIQVIGLPASIDNDIGLTSMAIGVDTAMNTITDACDKINDTASAHERAFLVEVMGRDCGYLAMTSGISSAADCVLFREAAKDDTQIVETVVKAVMRVRERNTSSRRVLAIVAEGTQVKLGALKDRVDARLRALLGEDAPPVETRVTVLGHVVRGGRPTAFDRLLASRLAHVAARLLLAGETRKMVGWMPPIELTADVGYRAEWDPYCWVFDLDAALIATRAMLDGNNPIVQWRKAIFEQVEDVLAW